MIVALLVLEQDIVHQKAVYHLRLYIEPFWFVFLISILYHMVKTILSSKIMVLFLQFQYMLVCYKVAYSLV